MIPLKFTDEVMIYIIITNHWVASELQNMAGKMKAGKSKSVSKETYKCSSNIDIQSFTDNNLYNYVAESDVGQSSKDTECWLGIDEAGRGPVLGK